MQSEELKSKAEKNGIVANERGSVKISEYKDVTDGYFMKGIDELFVVDKEYSASFAMKNGRQTSKDRPNHFPKNEIFANDACLLRFLEKR